MKRVICLAVLICLLVIPVHASEYCAPMVPKSGADIMPETQSFGEGLLDMVQKAMIKITPDYSNALKIGVGTIATVIIIAFVETVCNESEEICEVAGIVALSLQILANTNSMIGLGFETVKQISDYGNLLLPVLASSLAAQGGISTSAALYAGTAFFNTLLSSIMHRVLRPLIYCYLGLSFATAAVGESVLKNMRDLIKTFSVWCLKIMLTVFTTYMSLTGVISGATDAAVLKATKVTISSFVPVVGSILSDASDTVLIGAQMAKNAAGIYGIFALLAVFLMPFLRIGVHYLMLKGSFAVCTVLGSRRIADLIGDFSTAMGLLLAITGSVCIIQMISTICFLKGVG